MGLFNGITDAVFGSKPKSRVDTAPTMTPEQQRLMNETLLPFLESVGLDAGALELGEAQQTSLAGLEERALALAGPNTSSANALGGIFDQGGVGPVNTGAAANSGLENFTDPALFNELFTAGVTDPALREFNEVILPGISRRFNANTFFSRDRTRMDERALEDLLQSLSSERATGFLDRNLGASSELERSKRADLDRGLQKSGLDIQALLGAVSAGGVEGVDLRALGQIMEAGDFGRLAEQDQIKLILAALGIGGQENIATVTGGQQGLLGSFLGSSGGGAAVGDAIFG